MYNVKYGFTVGQKITICINDVTYIKGEITKIESDETGLGTTFTSTGSDYSVLITQQNIEYILGNTVYLKE